MVQIGSGNPMPAMPGSRRDAVRRGLLVLLRVTLTVVALFAAYYLIPTRSADRSDVPFVILELSIFAVVVGVQVPVIVKSKYPTLRALESLALLVFLFILIFARIYLSASLSDPTGFNQTLDHNTALYFTVTVLASVGFGDIVARSDGMRLLVTAQMLLNLVLLGLVIRLFSSAARLGVARRGQASAVDTDESRNEDCETGSLALEVRY